MKHLKALQAKDGWVITITETKTVFSLSEVQDEARYLNLTKDEMTIIPA